MNKSQPSLWLLSGILLFTGCNSSHSTPAHKEGYYYRGIFFGKNLSSPFKRGIRDGCETSRGVYTKSHKLFNQNIDYYNGWFKGRNKCRNLLRIDSNGDLIL
jgi:hypothetical protein